MMVYVQSVNKELDIEIKCNKPINESEFTNIQKCFIRDMAQTNGCRYTESNCVFIRQLENGGYVTIENNRAKLTSKGKSIAFKYK